jgi:hypothetical protein
MVSRVIKFLEMKKDSMKIEKNNLSAKIDSDFRFRYKIESKNMPCQQHKAVIIEKFHS